MSEVILLSRDQIDRQFKLNLDELFTSEDAWTEEVSSINRDLLGLSAYKGKLSENALTVFDALELAYSLKERESRVFAYALFSHLVDTTDQAATTIYQSAQSLRANLISSLIKKRDS